MIDFKPTWLYIKRHNVTGLKYFGKTVQKDPHKYLGSGLHWKNHLKLHGRNFSTIWTEKFYDKETLVDFATFFSKEANIVESADWANHKDENGLDGGFAPSLNKGRVHTEQARKNMSVAYKNQTTEEKRARALKISLKNIGRIQPIEEKIKQSASQKGRKYSEETNKKRGESNRGKIRSEETRLKIGLSGKGRTMSEETRLKISNTMRLRKNNLENRHEL